ncbi:deoxyribose-phosphate aldolase [Mycoplasma iguanae]|uniref:Deoxyribose-phosphate aldolase n=2 Tax=Mycoplasma iguanae TaxID=292461 RepID=A0ABY5R9J4_9MOLU|nr:deoxyribose-phosphate aldolase [Mycoplasma iguanae]UVD81842.1 deoxyribose-phosphate aldolase [Mycoplasma iguanae]
MNFNKMIDHTLLKPEAKTTDIDKLIQEAIEYQFATVCVNSSWVSYVYSKLKNTNVGITSVIGFPLGAMDTNSKVFEAKSAIEAGANEIDMVINIGRFKDHDYDYVLKEIQAIKKAIGTHILKVIIETALLSKEEILKISEIVVNSGADFIKTSTGFSTRGATIEDIILMKSVVGDTIEIKAAGGIRKIEDLESMHKEGATRFGTSSAVQILSNEKISKNNY